ncbi:2058_t:CDS:2 [Entrophospora sp. SA101]|nr:14090_t:CDS:2 [Entrophospora sp. SA101]CAJ0830370.1 1841_t:CDS:2 [Entrophospora sp. SA101]CAJ0836313.1 2058_t:CDS:2 [Entrophospora sp. SA101]
MTEKNNKQDRKINIRPLISTRNFLAEILQNAQNDYERAGVIQAFEVCYELASMPLGKYYFSGHKARHQKIVQQILSKRPYRFYAYGSRAKGNARRLSDLDLCYQEEIPDAIVFQIEEEFKESDLPFCVELVN